MFATLAGSYPRPAEVPPARALGVVLVAQADAGLGLLSDGIVHRSDDPSTLVKAWTAARDAAAADGIGLPVKLAVAGPWARVAPPAGTPRPPSSAADAPDGQASAALSAAATLAAALAAVIAAGCPVIEIHEPVATLPGGAGAGTAFAAAHRLLLAGLPAEAHATLAITGGDAEAMGAEALFGLPYRSYLFDLVAGPDSWRTIARAPGDRGIIVGVADATGRRSPGLEEVAWAASYAASLGGRGLARVGLAPSGGLDGLDPARAQALIGLLGEAARLLAGDPEELQRRFDPRAVDLRSAARGEYRPDPRGRPRGR
jgi:methionine synthase II (cobalamin-independent)